MVKKKVKRVSKNTVKKNPISKKKSVRVTSNKMIVVNRNLLLFFILFILSLILYNVSTNSLLLNLFFLLSVLFGFLVLTFLLVLLIFLIMKVLKK